MSAELIDVEFSALLVPLPGDTVSSNSDDWRIPALRLKSRYTTDFRAGKRIRLIVREREHGSVLMGVRADVYGLIAAIELSNETVVRPPHSMREFVYKCRTTGQHGFWRVVETA